MKRKERQRRIRTNSRQTVGLNPYDCSNQNYQEALTLESQKWKWKKEKGRMRFRTHLGTLLGIVGKKNEMGREEEEMGCEGGC